MTGAAVRLGLVDIGDAGLAVTFTGPDCIRWTDEKPWVTDRVERAGDEVHRYGGYTLVCWVRLQEAGRPGVRVLRLKGFALQWCVMGPGGLAESLEAIAGPTAGLLRLEHVSFMRRNGPWAGTRAEYDRPFFERIEAA